MKKFIKENWFKLGILLFLATSILLTVFYFFIFLPREQKISIDQQNKEAVQKEVDRKNFLQNCLNEAHAKFKNDMEQADKLREQSFANVDLKNQSNMSVYLDSAKSSLEIGKENEKEARDICFRKYPQ